MSYTRETLERAIRDLESRITMNETDVISYRIKIDNANRDNELTRNRIAELRRALKLIK